MYRLVQLKCVLFKRGIMAGINFAYIRHYITQRLQYDTLHCVPSLPFSFAARTSFHRSSGNLNMNSWEHSWNVEANTEQNQQIKKFTEISNILRIISYSCCFLNFENSRQFFSAMHTSMNNVIRIHIFLLEIIYNKINNYFQLSIQQF